MNVVDVAEFYGAVLIVFLVLEAPLVHLISVGINVRSSVEDHQLVVTILFVIVERVFS